MLPGAIADYDAAITRQADYGKAYLNRGIAKFETGDYAGVITDLERARALDATQKELPRWIGIAHYETGHYETAFEVLTEAIDQRVADERTYFSRAVAQYRVAATESDEKKGSYYPKVIADLDEATKRGLASPEAFLYRGTAQFFLKQYTATISDLSRAIALGADSASTHYQVGFAYYENGGIPASTTGIEYQPESRRILCPRLRRTGQHPLSPERLPGGAGRLQPGDETGLERSGNVQ